MIVNISNEDLINYANGKKPVDVRKKYDISDLVLVRTTDAFPDDGIINSKAADNVLVETTSLFENSLEKNNYNNCVMPKYFNYRSTIHFCINGLVGNHMLGNFSSRDYFVFDKFLTQENNILALRSEDTYFKDVYNLSDGAFIAMSSNKFQELSKDLSKVDFFSKYDVFVYDINEDLKTKLDSFGNHINIEQLIVSYILNYKGYPSFLIGDHGYVESLNQDKDAYYMQQFLNKYCTDNNISSEKHYYSEVRENDFKIDINNKIKSVIDHYEYVVSNSSVDIEFKKVLLSYIPYMIECGMLYYEMNSLNYCFEDATSNIDKFISIIGEEEYNKLTNSYNSYLEETRLNMNEDRKSL